MQAPLKHFASPRFWRHYRRLPQAVQDLSDKSFELLKTDSQHPAPRLKRLRKLAKSHPGEVVCLLCPATCSLIFRA